MNMQAAISPRIVLVHPRFPENVGMAARACANMGCGELYLVSPGLWRGAKALPLATPRGESILDKAVFVECLDEAIQDCNLVIGTTARTGGWRKSVISPWDGAELMAAACRREERVAIVFGPEDRGLSNMEAARCGALIHIRTPGSASSLNLAQSVLLVLYEFARHFPAAAVDSRPRKQPATITAKEFSRLEAEFKKTLQILDCVHGRNADYHFLQWHRLLVRARLKRDEYDAFMGLFRQIKNKLRLQERS